MPTGREPLADEPVPPGVALEDPVGADRPLAEDHAIDVHHHHATPTHGLSTGRALAMAGVRVGMLWIGLARFT